jgi:hypothetical protein
VSFTPSDTSQSTASPAVAITAPVSGVTAFVSSCCHSSLLLSPFGQNQAKNRNASCLDTEDLTLCKPLCLDENDLYHRGLRNEPSKLQGKKAAKYELIRDEQKLIHGKISKLQGKKVLAKVDISTTNLLHHHLTQTYTCHHPMHGMMQDLRKLLTQKTYKNKELIKNL